MGFLKGQSNGSETSQEEKRRRRRKEGEGEKDDKGVGFSLTADEHYQIKNKRLTNVSAPIDNSDATTKKNTDLLKTKAGTTYVNNELAKKANQSNVKTALALKTDKFELTALNNAVNTLDANKTNNADFVTFSQNIATQIEKQTLMTPCC